MFVRWRQADTASSTDERAYTTTGAGGAGKLTHNDLVVNASNDVTSALKRTYQLMQAELSRSQFAQETLEQSTTALSSLTDSYSSVGQLLSSSKSLVGSLVRSQKSDTWYLETAFYILVGTIAWLLFRRILYGPFWWLVWLPLRFVVRVGWAVFGIFQSRELSATTGSGSTAVSIPSATATTATGTAATVNYYSGYSTETSPLPDGSHESLVDKIGRMASETEPIPTNSKKRMYEEEDVGVGKSERKDEL